MKSFNEMALKSLEAKINRYLYHANAYDMINGVIGFRCAVIENHDVAENYFSIKLTVSYKDAVIFSRTAECDIYNHPSIDSICTKLEEEFIRETIGYYLYKIGAADLLTQAVVGMDRHVKI